MVRGILGVVIAAALFLPGCTSGSSVTNGPWVDRTAETAASGLDWVDIASDASGAHLVAMTSTGNAIPSGDIWTSADYGLTWTNRTTGTPASGQRWASVASDTTGMKLVAATTAVDSNHPTADVWTSTDGGATWTKRTTVPSLTFTSVVASDASGDHLVLANDGIWTSSDAGATWTEPTPTGTPPAAAIDLASDASGSHLVAITANADVWTSSDAGHTWTNRTLGTPASGLDWQAVASDATGTHLVATNDNGIMSPNTIINGDVWVSSDAGATWKNATAGTSASHHEWSAVASDATGAHLVVANSSAWPNNDVWTSTDFGATWTNVTASTTASGPQWIRLASDASGAHLAAIGEEADGPCCFSNLWTNGGL